MLVYDIGLSAIRANQIALQTVANNIANAGVDGYHRQRVTFAESNPVHLGGFAFGTGVDVASIDRLRDAAVAQALTLNWSLASEAQTGLEALESIERLLTPSSGSLHARVTEFFNQIEQLAAKPSEEALRRSVLAAAEGVAREITAWHAGLDQIQSQVVQELQGAVSRFNELTSELADINRRIRISEAEGIQPNTLRDQRDLLVQELAQLTDLSPASLADEQSPLLAAGGWMVVGERADELSVHRAADGSLELRMSDGRGPVVPASGQIAALLAAHNDWTVQTRDALQEWTAELMSAVDTLQATGLGLNGGYSSLTGHRTVSQTDVPLSEADTLLPIRAGELSISVTDNLTGERTTHHIAIDPAEDSLEDVIAKMNSIAGVAASILPGSGHVQISAASGFLIDFAGRPSSADPGGAQTEGDTSGFLAALGIGSLFQTNDLRVVAVNEDLVKNPGLLAASRTGEPGDAGQLSRFIDLRDARLNALGGETLEGRLATITSSLGVAVRAKQAEVNHAQSQHEHLRNQQDAVSGVDPNEELLMMMQFQRAFQANARFMTSINETLDELLSLVR